MAAPHGYVEKLAELSAAGRPFASVTLVETIGSTPQDTGTKMLVDESGLVFGTVGGGEVENKSFSSLKRCCASMRNGATHVPVGRMELAARCRHDVRRRVKLLFEAYNFHEWRIVVFGAGHVAQVAGAIPVTAWNAA